MILLTVLLLTGCSGNGAAKRAEVLRSADTLTSVCKKVVTIPAPDEKCITPQGGYFDGKYYYQLFLEQDSASNEQNNVDRIVKVDAKSGKVVKISGPLPLNHGNDITYHPGLQRLLVVHNNPNRTLVSSVDPETLELDTTYTMPCMIYCMDYSPAHDRFVAGNSGGQNFCYLTSEFQYADARLDRHATKRTAGYTTQGCACDENFVYFVLYNENVITVYDWDSHLVTVIELTVGDIEPENISVVDGEIYVTCVQDGATVYRVTPKAR